MDHVVSVPNLPFEAMLGTARVHQIPAARDNLVWVIECLRTGVAAAIDGPDAAALDAWSRETGIEVTVILNTHTHGDHVGLNRALEASGRLAGMTVVGPAKVADRVPGLTRGVGEGDRVQVGALQGEVMLTEGHVDGHVSYLFGDVLFCGDTLFAGGCGYLYDGPPHKMFRSLMRLAALPAHTKVCCAHEYTQDNLRFAWSVEPGNEALARRIQEVWAVRAAGGCTLPSTIGQERETNPFLRPGSPTLKASVSAARGEIEGFAGVFAATRALKDTRSYVSTSDEGLPLGGRSVRVEEVDLAPAGEADQLSGR